MRYGKKLTPAIANVLINAINKLNKQYGDVLAHWGELTPEQKQAYIDHSPVLRRVLDWGAQWR